MSPLFPEARQHFTGVLKSFLAKGFDQKSAPHKALSALVRKLGADNVEVVACGCVSALGHYEELCTELASVKGSVKGWNKKNFILNYTESFKMIQEAAKMNRRICHDLDVLKSVRLLEVRQLSGDRRKAALAVRRVAKALVSQNYWKSALTWYGQTALGIKPDAKANELNVSGNLGKAQARADSRGKHYALPQLWTAEQLAEGTGLASPLSKLRNALDVQLTFLQPKLTDRFKEDNPNWVNHCFVPVSEAFKPEHVPSELLGGMHYPQGWTTFAKPVMLGGKYLGWRFGTSTWRHPGVGGAIWGLNGEVSVLLISMSALAAAGGTITMLSEFLNGLTGADASCFLQSHATFFKLPTGGIAWIPWGHHVSMVTTSQVSVTLFVPWYCKALLAEGPANVTDPLKKWSEELLDCPGADAEALQTLLWWRS